ncbi:hypothetical protein F5Y18DRAFT_421670 [Xylariaceae sp. FL1019]|nr:hypothetical protein F5Y18DRAFT_421670 [Xylariaceae sp. FL1019]
MVIDGPLIAHWRCWLAPSACACKPSPKSPATPRRESPENISAYVSGREKLVTCVPRLRLYTPVCSYVVHVHICTILVSRAPTNPTASFAALALSPVIIQAFHCRSNLCPERCPLPNRNVDLGRSLGVVHLGTTHETDSQIARAPGPPLLALQQATASVLATSKRLGVYPGPTQVTHPAGNANVTSQQQHQQQQRSAALYVRTRYDDSCLDAKYRCRARK